MKLTRLLLLLPLLLSLSGCHGASLATQWKLRDFNIARADLAQLRIAARGPEWVTITPDRAAIETKIRTGEDKKEIGSIFLHLQSAAHASDQAELQRLSPGALTVLELDATSLETARQLQQETQRLKAEGLKVTGALHLHGALACRHEKFLPSGPILIDVLVHASDEFGWLPLYEQYDLRRDELTADKLDETLPPCPGARRAR